MPTLPADRPTNAHTPEIRTDGPGGSSLGDTLRRARERRGLTLAQVSTETKITRQHLEALERGTFINVPSGFYQRAQIRTYARAVGLDPALALEQLDHQAPPVAPVADRAPEPEARAPRTRKPVVWRKRALVAIGGVLAAVALGRAMGQWEPSRDSNPDSVSVPHTLEQPRPDGARKPDLAEAPVRVSREEPPSAPVEQLTPAIPASVSEADAPGTRPDAKLASAAGTLPAAAPSRPARPVAAQVADTPVVATTKRAVEPPVDQSATRAATPPGSGLVVTTAPAGARVTVNGIAWGTTPLTIRYLPPGDKRIRVSKDGFAAQERTIQLSDGRSTAVNIQLRSAP